MSPDLMCLAIPAHRFICSREEPARSGRIGAARPGSTPSCLDHFARQRHDLHEVLVAQLAGPGAEETRAARVVLLVDHDRRVLVEADVGAVAAERGLLGPHDDAANDLALLDVA